MGQELARQVQELARRVRARVRESARDGLAKCEGPREPNESAPGMPISVS